MCWESMYENYNMGTRNALGLMFFLFFFFNKGIRNAQKWIPEEEKKKKTSIEHITKRVDSSAKTTTEMTKSSIFHSIY